MPKPDLVVVWGNCQAAPLADLLRDPLHRAGLEVVDVPPVYLAQERDVARAHRLVGRAAFLVSNPVREEYRFAGSGTQALAAELPAGGRLITVASAYHVGPFPFLVNAHGADGTRVDAPVTVYHDLRAVVAASRQLTVLQALRWWPVPGVDELRRVDDDSLRELKRRQQGLDVPVADLVTAPAALWSMNHPTNRTLGELARRVLRVMGVQDWVAIPHREYLGERRAPVESTVARALGWPDETTRPTWIVGEETIEADDLLARQLEFYARRTDVVRDTVLRHAGRIRALIGG